MKNNRMTSFMKTLMTVMPAVCLLMITSCENKGENITSQSKAGNKWVTTVSCYNCLSEECLNNLCDPSCSVSIRECHEVDSTIFAGMVKSFFNGNIPKPKAYAASHIDSVINLSSCQNPDIICVCADHDNNTDNNNITVGILQNHTTHCQSKAALEKVYNKEQIMGLASYSRAFFSSLMETNPDSFRFYKAIGISRRQNNGCRGVSKNDIVFETIKVNVDGSITTNYYDLSDLFP